ncbi:MAG: flavin reductase family protein, partial [Flavobacteriales bacterium]
NDLGQLGMAPTLPTTDEIVAFASNLGQALDTNSAHHQAHNLLQEGNVEDAWKTLLTLELN